MSAAAGRLLAGDVELRRSRRWPLVSARSPTSEARPSAFSETRAPSLKRGRLSPSLFRPGAAARRSVSSGVCSRARLPSSTITGRSSTRKSSSRSKSRARSSRRSAETRAVSSASSMKRTTSSRRSVRLGEDRVGVGVEAGDDRVLAAEDLQHLAELAQRRGAGADRGVEVLGVADQRRPELVDDQLEAALERLAQRVLDEVVLDRGLVAGGLDRRPRAAPSALPGWQSRKYSAISDCGSDEQLASALNSGNSGPTSKVTSAVFSGGDVEVGDRAGLDAGDAQLRRPRPGRRR